MQILIHSMDSSAAIRSFFHCLTGTMSHMQSSLQKPGKITIHSVGFGWNSQSMLFTQSLAIGAKRINPHNKWKRTQVSCAKTTDAINGTKSEASLNLIPKEPLEGKPLQSTGFPSGIEALVSEVCDETQIAELRVKVGEFEMHMKRNVGVTKVPMSNISSTKPMVESAPSVPPPSPEISTSKKANPFVSVSIAKSSKLAALDASGSNNYVMVSSPTVGSFRRGRTVKGKKQPPICKEGDVIKEGQVIGYLDLFGISIPVKTDVGGEVLKLLFQDGEAVGYGDPLIAVLPSFQNSN